jgi:hypothetical protein
MALDAPTADVLSQLIELNDQAAATKRGGEPFLRG